MSRSGRSRRLSGWMLLVLLAVIAGFYLLMKRAEHRMTEDIGSKLGLDGGMTEEEQQEFIEYMNQEMESTR